MADTQRTVSEIQTLLADNATGDISAQDLRDALETWRPRHGQMYVASGDGAATAISDTTNYVECVDQTWTLDSMGSYEFDESAGNGRLTYIGTADIMLHCAATISFTSASNNQVLSWRIGVSGTTMSASEVQVKVGTGSDVQSTAMHYVGQMSAGDYLSLFVRNTSSTASVTLAVANLQLMSMPTQGA